MTKSYIQLHAKHFNFKQFIIDAFHEDVGDGDHTSLSTIPANHIGKMRLYVKENGILAGMEATKEIFKIVDPKFKYKAFLKDGDQIKKGDIAFEISGNSQKLLTTERLVLNIMQRMSGIATHTTHLMNLCKGTKAKVIDTRKTTPGFRFFEKWAVVIGGGANHRYGLFDMILIKDNHIDFAGGIVEAIDTVHRYQKKNKKKLKVEIEVRSLKDIKLVLSKGGVNRILIDNFTPQETKEAIQLIGNKFDTESSGGINEKNIAKYAASGVGFISVGALTHHVKSLDLSLKAVK